MKNRITSITNMKKIITFLIILLVHGYSWGQSSANYSFSTATDGSLIADMNGNTINMSTGTSSLLSPQTSQDDVASSATNIGFPFFLMGNVYTQFSINSNGIVQLGSTVIGGATYTVSGGSTTSPKISAFGADLGTGTNGAIKSKVVGSTPNRCLVIEFNNMTLNWTSAYTNEGTYQVRLYENGIIEFVYGTMNPANASSSSDKTTGIGFSTNTTANNFAYITSSSNTSTTSGSFTDNTEYAVGNIANLHSTSDGSRRYYRYTPASGMAAPTSLNFTSISTTGMTLNWTAASPTTNVLK